MGFAQASFRFLGDSESLEGVALVDSGAWYTVIDERLAARIGVKYTGLTVTLTSFSGHRIPCREAILKAVTIEGRTAPSEIVAVCKIPKQVRELLEKHEVNSQVVIGVHTLERLGYAIDTVTYKLIKSPGILMI